MVPPNLNKVVIDLGKITGYVLNLNHPEGRHKARVFMSALGLTGADGGWLVEAIRCALPNAGIERQSETEWGTIYRADLVLRRGERCARVRTAWLCSDMETRLITCYVVGECDETA